MSPDEKFTISTYSITAGQDNKITIDAGTVKYETLRVTISGGTITPADHGDSIVHVTGIERALIAVYNSKKNKRTGMASLEVR